MEYQKVLKLTAENHAFFRSVVAPAIQLPQFKELVWMSVQYPTRLAQYPLCGERYEGYIRINGASIAESSFRNQLVEDLYQTDLLRCVALQIPDAIKGELNSYVTITHGMYEFAFRITKYERGSAHKFEMIKDPLSLAGNERLGRFVELRVRTSQLADILHP